MSRFRGVAQAALAIFGLAAMMMANAPSTNAAAITFTTPTAATSPQSGLPGTSTAFQLRSQLPHRPALDVNHARHATNTPIGTFAYSAGGHAQVFRTGNREFHFGGKCVGIQRANGERLGVLRPCSSHTQFNLRTVSGNIIAFNFPGQGWLTAHRGSGFIQVTFTPGNFNRTHGEEWEAVVPHAATATRVVTP